MTVMVNIKNTKNKKVVKAETLLFCPFMFIHMQLSYQKKVFKGSLQLAHTFLPLADNSFHEFGGLLMGTSNVGMRLK